MSDFFFLAEYPTLGINAVGIYDKQEPYFLVFLSLIY